MKRNRLFQVVILMVPLLLFSLWSFAQPITVQGKVKDTEGVAMPGVTVMLKGTTQGTITSMDGDYTLKEIKSDGVLVFSFIGMKTEEVAINGQATINVEMKADVSDLDEVVVIGYGSVKKQNLRMADIPNAERSFDKIKEILLSDLENFSLEEGQTRKSTIGFNK